MTPPEVILDRFVRTHFRHEPGCAAYLGKLDIGQVESPLRDFLYHTQETLNEELRLEGVNASGGVSHPPFHFDYLSTSDGVRNAHAFQYEGFAFIVITLPMAQSIGNLSFNLSRSRLVRELLHLDSSTELDELQELLFDIQLHFLVSHEYTHHIHQHGVKTQNQVSGLWTEFGLDTAGDNMISQAEELDADGYAAYLVLTHFLLDGGRASALVQLGQRDISPTEGDELLLACFFLAALAFFCDFWRGGTDMNSIRQLTHPPPPIRITYTIRVAEMWCGQNASVPQSWFTPDRFQELFRAAAEIISENTRRIWDAQMSFFKSTEGAQYDQELLETFEAVRQRKNEPVKTAQKNEPKD
ncbi:MAG TPA: hypothetical protein VNX70_04940 [Bryobacteraceae bacterium]|jgi:hypothetical protein|nr:hypothetical protein [Bryobacteraceae bacterium]